MVEVPSTRDVIQEADGVLTTPEIRVWCHPHKIGKSGDDFYMKFNSFSEAVAFIKNHPEAEAHPLIAIQGYELDLFAIEKIPKRKK